MKFNRGATTQAKDMGVYMEDIVMNNRSRKFDKRSVIMINLSMLKINLDNSRALATKLFLYQSL